MRKSVGLLLALNHRRFLLLGVVLILAGFGVTTWQASAKNGTAANLGTDNQKVKVSPKTYDFNHPEPRVVPKKDTQVKQGDGKAFSGKSYKNDTSIALRDMTPDPYVGKPMDREANENPKVPHSEACKCPGPGSPGQERFSDRSFGTRNARADP